MKTVIYAFVAALAIPLVASQSFANTTAADCEAETNYQEVTKAELETMVKAKSAFIIDANGKDSYKKQHIGTAIDYKSIKSQKDGANAFVAKLPAQKDALIVAYCGGPQCAAWKEAAEEACQNGYTNIRHFKGGLTAWKDKKWTDKKM